MKKFTKMLSVMLSVLLIWQSIGANPCLMASAAGTEELSLSLGAAQPGATINGIKTYYYKNAAVTGSGIKTILLSFSENVTGGNKGDKIILPAVKPDSFIVSSTSANNDYTKRINIDAGASASAVQSYLQGIGFQLAGTSQSVKVTITTQSIQYDTFYDIDTQHYYQYIPTVITETWADAYNSAEGMEYMGRTGYLATITSQSEDTFVNSLSGGKVGWLGGTAMNNTGTSTNSLYYSGFSTNTTSGSNWYWACGPERGKVFYYGRTTADRSSNTGTDPYWNWFSGEPNGTTTAITGEDCLTTLPNESRTGNRAGEHTSNFSWNDIVCNNNEGDFSAQGYFVEYGNMALGDSITSAGGYASVTGSLSSSSYTASIGGSPVCGHKLTADFIGGSESDTVTYQWMRGDGVIFGATEKTYMLTAADVGRQISVKITDGSTTVTSPTVTVTALKLDTALSEMPDIAEDLSTGSNSGELVSDLLSGKTSGAGEDTLGVAVTATDNTNGQWQYSMDSGSSWFTIPQHTPALSETEALLLPSTAKIRFVSAANYNGTATITYRAWDETLDGTSEARADVSANGAGTAYSAQKGGAKITITAVNDSPDVIKKGGGKALEFPGDSSQVMAVPDMHLNSSFTVGCWVKAYDYKTWQRIFDFGNGESIDNQILGFYDNGGYASKNMYMEFYENGKSAAHLVTPDVFPLNQWIYVTAVYDSGTQTGYIYWNGILQVSGYIPRQAASSLPRNCSYFGKSNWTRDAYFKGKMYNISVWNVAKSQTEIRSDMNTTPTGSESGLVAAYNLTEGSGTAAADCSPAHNNATLTDLNWVDNSEFNYSVSGYENSNIAVGNLEMTDVDAGGGTVQLKLAASHGTLSFGSTVGLTFSNCSNKQASITVKGTMQSINAALAALTYDPNADYTGTDLITAQADDLGCTGEGGAKQSDVKKVNVTVLPVAVPDAPTVTSVISGGSYDSATVTFNPPLNNGGGSITGYTITAKPEGAGNLVSASGGSPLTVSGLQPGITYTFTAAAKNSAGTGPASSPVIYTTPGRPTAPTVNATISGSSYNGNWTNENVTIVAYGSTAVADTISRYEYKVGLNGKWTALTSDHTLTVDTDMNDSVYFRAVGSSGLSGYESVPCNVKVDKSSPADMTVKVHRNSFATFLNTITFGLFFSNDVDVTLSASDAMSGVDYYEYQLIDTSKGQSYKTENTWTRSDSGKFSVSPQFKGAVYAYSVDKAGNKSAVISSNGFVADSKTPAAPIVTATVNGNNYNNGTWVFGDVKLVASGPAVLSGIDHYEYKIGDSGVWTTMPNKSGIKDSTSGLPIADNLTITTDMNKDVHVRAVSNSQVTGTDSIITVRRDSVNPALNVDVSGTTGQWTNSPVNFTLSDTAKNISPVTYLVKIGSGDWTQISENTVCLTTDTNTTYQFKAVSASGIQSGVSTVYTVQIDKDEPTITNVSGNPINWTYGNATLTVNAEDTDGSGIKEYSFDGGDNWQASPSKTYTSDQTISAGKIMVRDNAGNITSYNNDIAITKIDKTVPSSPIVTIASSPVKQILNALTFGLFFNDTVNVTLSSADNLSGVREYEYQLVSDGGALAGNAWKACGGTFSINPQFKGTIYARAVDNAANISAAAQSDKFVTDKKIPTAPSIAETVGGKAYGGTSWTSGNIKLVASGSSALSGIDHYEYSTDNGDSWAKMEGQSLKKDSTSGQYINDIQTISTNMNCSVIVRAVSNSGIKGETASVYVKRDAVVPSFNVAISGTVGQWTGSPVTFTVTGTGGNLSSVTYYIKIGTAGWVPVSGNTITFSSSMNETCQFKAVSAAGNEATSSGYAVMIDANLPTVSVSGNPADWTNKNVTLGVNAECSPYGVQSVTVSKDGGSAVDITGQDTYTVAENGNYVFTAINLAGSPVSKTVNVTKIDKAAPTGMTVKVHRNSFTSFENQITFGMFFSNTVDITLLASDSKSGVDHYEYQLVDTNKGQSYDKNGTWTESSGGIFSVNPQFRGEVYAYAVDRVGNNSPVISSNGFVADSKVPSSPNVTADVDGESYNSDWTSGDVKIVSSGSSALSGIKYYEYKIGDSGTWTTMPDKSGDCDSTSGNSIADSISITYDMNNDVHIRAVSNSGISGDESIITVKRDSVIPLVHVMVSGTTGQWTEDPVTFTFTNTADNISPVVYWVKIGSKDWKQISDITYTITGNVNTTYKFKAVSSSGCTVFTSEVYRVKLASNALKAVVDDIDSLPDSSDASDNQITDSEQAIKDAKILYDTLSSDEQSGVGQSRIDKLNGLISRLNAILVIIPKDTDTGITAGNIGTSVQLPELNSKDVGKVVVKLVVNPIAVSTHSNIAVASEVLSNSGSSLVATYDVSLIKSVFDVTGNKTSSGKISNSSITGPITVRIPVPVEYRGRTNLKVVYIDDSGNVTPLATALVTVDGVQYLQFTATHFSMYAVTAPNEKAASIPNPKTGNTNNSLPYNTAALFSLLFFPTSAEVIARRKRRKEGRCRHL